MRDEGRSESLQPAQVARGDAPVLALREQANPFGREPWA